MSKENITIKKDTLWRYSTFVLAALLIIGAFAFFSKNDSGSNAANNQQQPSNLPSQNAKSQVSADNDAFLGDKNAKVTIIEFSDYQCPFCKKFWTEALPGIKKDYIDTGKVKLVYRDFPLSSIHPNAEPAAEAVECVREAGKGDAAYFKMHDKIFENQQSLSVDNLKSWAKQLGYNIDTCLDSGKFKSEVQKDIADGAAAGVQGTPTFFVNGKALVGAQPYSAFKQAIDSELGA